MNKCVYTLTFVLRENETLFFPSALHFTYIEYSKKGHAE